MKRWLNTDQPMRSLCPRNFKKCLICWERLQGCRHWEMAPRPWTRIWSMVAMMLGWMNTTTSDVRGKKTWKKHGKRHAGSRRPCVLGLCQAMWQLWQQLWPQEPEVSQVVCQLMEQQVRRWIWGTEPGWKLLWPVDWTQVCKWSWAPSWPWMEAGGCGSWQILKISLPYNTCTRRGSRTFPNILIASSYFPAAATPQDRGNSLGCRKPLLSCLVSMVLSQIKAGLVSFLRPPAEPEPVDFIQKLVKNEIPVGKTWGKKTGHFVGQTWRFWTFGLLWTLLSFLRQIPKPQKVRWVQRYSHKFVDPCLWW